MNLNIQEIVENKIKSLNDNGTIKAAIEKTIEETLMRLRPGLLWKMLSGL